MALGDPQVEFIKAKNMKRLRRKLNQRLRNGAKLVGPIMLQDIGKGIVPNIKYTVTIVWNDK